jgi:broad specificity phosphatase PhoE
LSRAARALLLALVLLSASAVHAHDAPPSARATTVILVRHAEKNEHPPGGDAGLSTSGLVRAQALARTLQDSGVDAIFASRYPRARLTAEPLGKALGDSVRIYDPNDLPALAKAIREDLPGRTVLVVGHSDTIAPTIAELGGPALAKGETVAYDRLYVLTLDPPAEPRLLRLAYGDAPR